MEWHSKKRPPPFVLELWRRPVKTVPSRMKWILNKRFLKWAIGICLAGFIGLNILAFQHARAMMVYAPDGPRTRSPEQLSIREKVKIILCGVHMPRPVDERTPTALAPSAEELFIPVRTNLFLSTWHCNSGPQSPLVILFHGYSTEKTSLLPEACAFLEMGCSVLLVDFRGSGGSSGHTATFGAEEAEDVAAVMNYIQQADRPHGPVILYGFSMGAAAIVRAIHEFQIAPDGIILAAVFDNMLQSIRNRFQSMGVPSFPAAELLVFWGGAQRGFNGFRLNPEADAVFVECPALVLHGRLDPRAKWDEGHRVWEALRSPRKTFVLFDTAGHESYWAVEGDRWHQAVSRFLSGR